MSFLCAPPSSRPTSALHLSLLLQDAQRHERQLWGARPGDGSDQLALAEAADNAWIRLRIGAEALVSQALPNTHSRETRLLAALLLAVLDAAEPQHVECLQELARQIADDDGHGLASQLDPLTELLRFIAQGPFVMSTGKRQRNASDGAGVDVAFTIHP